MTAGTEPQVAGPDDQHAKAGQPVRFQVAVDAPEQYNFEWRENDKPIPNSDGPALEIPNVKPDHDGRTYSVVVTNKQDPSQTVTSGPARLTVETVAPTTGAGVGDGDDKLRLTGPDDQQIEVGGGVKFSVQATGGSGRYSFAWQQDGRLIPHSDQAFYTVSPTRSDDNGRTYSVIVTDKEDPSRTATSRSATLTVRSDAPASDPGSPAWWSNPFAVWAAVALILVFGMLLWPVKWSVDALIGAGKSNLAAVIAIQLVAVGLLAMLGGLYLAVLEVRGRSVTYHQLRELLRLHRTRGERVDQADVDMTGEVFKGLPDVIRAFAQLRAPAAALILAAVCLLAAAALAWRTIGQ